MAERKKNSVLIVDDESLNIRALTSILNPEYTVYAAKNGTEAVRAAENYRPDVILLDIIMPGIDGFAVLEKLKRSKDTYDIPVIFITSLTDTVNEEKGLEMGAADYISKPFSEKIVKLRVQKQINILKRISLHVKMALDELMDVN